MDLACIEPAIDFWTCLSTGFIAAAAYMFGWWRCRKSFQRDFEAWQRYEAQRAQQGGSDKLGC